MGPLKIEACAHTRVNVRLRLFLDICGQDGQSYRDRTANNNSQNTKRTAKQTLTQLQQSGDFFFGGYIVRSRIFFLDFFAHDNKYRIEVSKHIFHLIVEKNTDSSALTTEHFFITAPQSADEILHTISQSSPQFAIFKHYPKPLFIHMVGGLFICKT